MRIALMFLAFIEMVFALNCKGLIKVTCAGDHDSIKFVGQTSCCDQIQLGFVECTKSLITQFVSCNGKSCAESIVNDVGAGDAKCV